MLNRTDLTEEARIALDAECMVRRAGLKEVASDLILSGISPKAKEIMVLMSKGKKAKTPKEEKVIKPNKRYMPISEEEENIIKEMYAQDPRPSFAKIGKAVGRQKGVVHRWIQQNIMEEKK